MDHAPLNPAEDFATRVCLRSCLSLWCYSNPRGKGGKELCDVLVVFEPHVIIISVKDIPLKQDTYTEWQRWQRRAVEESVKQLYGADRWLTSADRVRRRDGTPGLPLPAPSERLIHRIALACGGAGEIPTASGDFGKGFVHVMTEQAFFDVLRELDTIGDLVSYLTAKEALITRGCSVVIEGSEANLVGLYLFHGRTFPPDCDRMIVDDGIWSEIAAKPEFQRRKELDRESYAWDALIEALIDPNADAIEGSSIELTDLERALRAMAMESRFARRVLGQGLRTFIIAAQAGQIRSRALVGPSGVIYVLVYFRAGEDAQCRRAELGNRCFLARHVVGRGDTIVGVGLGEYQPGTGSTSDLIYLQLPDWSSADDDHAVQMKAALGFFDKATVRQSHEDEFPST
jgi:hypothetical protein